MSTIPFFSPCWPSLIQTKHADCKWNWSLKGTCRLYFSYRPVLTTLWGTQRHKIYKWLKNDNAFNFIDFIFDCHPAFNINILVHTSVCVRGGEPVTGWRFQPSQSVTVLGLQGRSAYFCVLTPAINVAVTVSWCCCSAGNFTRFKRFSKELHEFRLSCSKIQTFLLCV